MLPGHDHIITTRNEGQPEWWPVVAVGVTSKTAWTAITTAKDYTTMKALEGKPNSGVTGEIPTNVILWFQSLPGHISAPETTTNSTAVPPAAPAGPAINNLEQDCTTNVNGCTNQNSDFIGLTHDYIAGTDVNAIYSGPFFCDRRSARRQPASARQEANTPRCRRTSPRPRSPTRCTSGSTDYAALRLVTCGGKFDVSARSYLDNIVAYASLVGVHEASPSRTG